MSEEGKRKGLGRGLAALLGEDPATPPATAGEADRAAPRQLSLPIEHLVPNRYQPRTRFDEDALAQLADSIREKGIIQPIVVRRSKEAQRYEIVAGERRWRAAQRAQLHQVPVVVRDFSDAEALEIAILENIQRQDLNAVEEALAYRRLQREFNYTQEQLGQALGKSRSHIANTLRLLGLPETVRAMIADGKLTAGHARTLVAAEQPETLARRIVAEGLNVRQAEELVAGEKSVKAGGKSKPGAAGTAVAPRPDKDADTLALESSLSDQLGLKVAIALDGRGEAGELRISFKDFDQLDDLCRRLSR
ncbi:MAG: ParB/RepB/Spo0J family partition protein [Alphaproteobacteria bacterium]|jgi:ParB family chromosome partitioning protein|nr:ParB/RepB/Spo0J family partition protein [Alphaproteobacteria bacterium]